MEPQLCDIYAMRMSEIRPGIVITWLENVVFLYIVWMPSPHFGISALYCLTETSQQFYYLALTLYSAKRQCSILNIGRMQTWNS